MLLKRRIQSFLLLTVYLIVLIHSSVFHSHIFDQQTGAIFTSQSHSDVHAEDHHHAEDVHVGEQENLFHLLGHLFEGVNHMFDPDDVHVFVSQKVATTKIFTSIKPCLLAYATGSVLTLSEALIELRVPPDDQLTSDIYLKRDHLQRGPPPLG